MTLKEIFPHFNLDKKIGNIKIKGVSDDSESTDKGDMFFVIRRKNFNIFSVLKALEDKVAIFIADFSDQEIIKDLIKKKPVVFVKDIRKEFIKAVDTFYGFNNKDLKFIGITGTNGKTTTALLVYHLLRKLNQKVSLIGTLKYIIGSKEQRASYTTPDFLKLRKIIKKIKDAGSKFVVMEVSSHALSQDRIKNIKFLRCLFTNLSRDHLDYHKTHKNYFKAKKRLFFQNKSAISLINIDDNYGKKLYKQLPNKISYGFSDRAALRPEDVSLNREGCRFVLNYLGKSYPVKSTLCGKHNVMNILGAIGLILSLGFSPQQVIELITSFPPVEGRLEAVEKDIFVDYAHTPCALNNVLKSLRHIGYGKVICVFGCGGDRDKGKRKLMGRVACQLADFTFITSDNPRSEDPFKICRQIEKGFTKNNYSIVVDRKKAIKMAIDIFSKNSQLKKKSKNRTCLLVAGKGHEDYQIIGDKRIPFKDSQVIKEIIKKGYSSNLVIGNS